MDYLNSYTCIAACTLKQWALDFEGNKKRIISSILEAKSQGAKIRIGTELEVSGYSLEDHFFELDTMMHSWEVIRDILKTNATDNILCVTSMPLFYCGHIYNCCLIMLDRKLVLIRPKTILAEDGVYREGRWFTEWIEKDIIQFQLPSCITNVNGQVDCPMGVALLRLTDTIIGFEICQEVWSIQPLHQQYYLEGVEIILNNNASVFEKGKRKKRIELIEGATKKFGGTYVYSNYYGNDGGKLYFDGHIIFSHNGKIVKVNEPFRLFDYQVTTATVNLHSIKQVRLAESSIIKESFNFLSKPHQILVNFKACIKGIIKASEIIENPVSLYKSDEFEVVHSIAETLWNLLVKTKASGFFLPLSGGLDSGTVAYIIHKMCCIVYNEIALKNENVLKELRDVLRIADFMPSSPEDICQKIFYTAYLSTRNSSTLTQKISQSIASEIKSNHLSISIDELFNEFLDIAINSLGKTPKFKVQGGTHMEDVALQNIQARIRMVISYLFSQAIPWNNKVESFLLVLSAGNKDECLRGFVTKYDCSSADFSPLSDLGKGTLRQILEYGQKNFGWQHCNELLNAVATPELTPLKEGQICQTDETEMGMTYQELEVFGYLRKVQKCGAYSMFCELLILWKHLTPREIAAKVKHFFKTYSINRHKATVMTPGVHLMGDSNEDTRFDLRPFVYNTEWTYQFKKINETLEEIEKNNLYPTSKG